MKFADSSDRLWLAVLTIAAGFFCAVLVGIPVAEHRGFLAASWVRFGLSPACHQITDRCLDLGAGPLPVCARCAGLYAGGLVGLLVTLVSGRRFLPPLRWLAMCAPTTAGCTTCRPWPTGRVSLQLSSPASLRVSCSRTPFAEWQLRTGLHLRKIT